MKRVAVLMLVSAVMACGRKPGPEPAERRADAPASATTPAAIPAATPAPSAAAPADVPPGTERHTHLKGKQTEAICTSLADVQQFYTAGQDQTQESLSCSMIFGGHSTADVAVLATQGEFVHVRLYDRTGHFSDGYMRAQALQ